MYEIGFIRRAAQAIVWHMPAVLVTVAYIAIAIAFTPAALWGVPAMACWIACDEVIRRIAHRRPTRRRSAERQQEVAA